MALALYQYSISNDTQNGKLVLSVLKSEIGFTSISIALDATTHRNGDVLSLVFKSALSAGEQTILNQTVAAHEGILPEEKPTPVELKNVDIDEDGKVSMSPFPAPEGFNTWLAGRGDDPNPAGYDSGRGDGQPLMVTFSDQESGTKYIDVRFTETIALHDGEVNWTPKEEWGKNDEFGVGVFFPATPTEAAPGSDGNCNKVPIPGGNMIIPAAGDGAYNVDLSSASVHGAFGTVVPIPANGSLEMGGFWAMDIQTSIVSPIVGDEKKKFALLDFSPPIGWLIKRIPTISSRAIFELDVYRVEVFHPNWRLRFSVTRQNQPSEESSIGGWLFGFRKNAS
jgi:hypothetical protein